MKSKLTFNSSVQSQQERLLDWLKQKPITTVDARKILDICSPAARIYELRHERKLRIMTHWVDQRNQPGGIKHRIAKYVLFPGIYRGVSHENI